MTYMGQPLQSHRTWTCACGRLGLALALPECPACGEPRERPQARPARKRATAKGAA